eukprot:SAG22_NODE_59_length_23617_cov_252.868144_8_plen_140_part_00
MRVDCPHTLLAGQAAGGGYIEGGWRSSGGGRDFLKTAAPAEASGSSGSSSSSSDQLQQLGDFRQAVEQQLYWYVHEMLKAPLGTAVRAEIVSSTAHVLRESEVLLQHGADCLHWPFLPSHCRCSLCPSLPFFPLRSKLP